MFFQEESILYITYGIAAVFAIIIASLILISSFHRRAKIILFLLLLVGVVYFLTYTSFFIDLCVDTLDNSGARNDPRFLINTVACWF